MTTQRPPCVGCGLVTPPWDGPTHPYMLSSPGCWSLYSELLATGAGQAAVDAYAVQHPGVPERRATQSVAVHLVSLCAALERGWPPDRCTDLVRHAVDRPPVPRWPWLAPPPPVGTVTVFDVLLADARADAVARWSQDLWGAYDDHHATVRGWLDRLTVA